MRRSIRAFSDAAARSVNVNATIAVGLDAVGEQRGDALRDDLGLAGAGRRDDLEVAAAVLDRGATPRLRVAELRTLRQSRSRRFLERRTSAAATTSWCGRLPFHRVHIESGRWRRCQERVRRPKALARPRDRGARCSARICESWMQRGHDFVHAQSSKNGARRRKDRPRSL